MNWSRGYTASCYVSVVDSVTWRDVGRIEITNGSVSRSTADLRESATIDFVDYDQTAERWIRVWMDARQEDDAEHVPIFTGLAVSPDRDINGNLTTNSVDCYSVLKPAKDILLARGWYAPAGANGAEYAKNLLSVSPAPIVVEDDAPILQTAYIAEDKETALSMAVKLLDAINWRIRIDGDGTIHIMPQASEPTVIFENLTNDVLEPKLTVSYDWFSCPNVFRAIQGNAYAIATDDSPDSIFSTTSRGREIWAQETSCKLNTNESLAEYAARRLKELQNVVQSASYDRRFHPGVTVGDLVRLHYPSQDIDGVFRVTKQDIDIGKGCSTAEEADGYGN